MLMMKTSARKDALATLTAAVAAHRAGGEVSTRLDSDWSDGAGLPTIVVRIGNRVTMKQGGTFHEAAEFLLGWVSRQAEGVQSASRFDNAR
jgi:hypothetical protein